MARIRDKHLFVALAMLVMLACAMPQIAFAADASLQGATIAAEQQQLEAPTASISYTVGKSAPWTWQKDGATSALGKNGQFSAIRAKVKSSLGGSLQYQVRVNGTGWQAVKADGKVAGKTGAKAQRVEAVRFALTGELSKWFDVKYRVMTSNGKWQAYKKNGQVAGSAGSKLRGVSVELVPKAKQGKVAGAGIVGVRYHTKLKNQSWQEWVANNARSGKAAKNRRITNLAISLDRGTYTGGIKYRVRLSNGKWKAWKKNGAKTGAFNNIEAVQIKLTGKIANDYDVVYRTYVSGVGWQARVANGDTAGTGKGRRIGALKVQIVKKDKRSGWVGSGKDWSYYENGTAVTSQWITTQESPINVMTAKTHKYWIDANGKLAVKRVVNPKKTRDAAAGYVGYATKWGYVLQDEKFKTSKGYIFADENGALYTSTGWLETDQYDSDSQKYYMASNGVYSVAKTGLFKVKGKRYYGLPDEGYVMRSDTDYIDGKWYTANDDGVLGKATSTATHIEQYVRWAINIANDNRHGYTQDLSGRWGPDYDCSSLVVSALKATGLNPGGATWTGNMRSELTSHGFRWHTDFSKLRRGDILLVHRINGRQHTEIYIGNGLTVGAHIAETGGIYGRTGDQTGHEIDVGPYYSIWQGYLRLGS